MAGTLSMIVTFQPHLQLYLLNLLFKLNDFLTMEAAYEICPGPDAL